MNYDNVNFKILFIENYLKQSNTFLTLPKEWFYTSEPVNKNDPKCQSYRIVDMFVEYNKHIISELKKVGIEVIKSRDGYKFVKQ